MYASVQIMDENEHQKLQPTGEFLLYDLKTTTYV